MGGDIYLWLLWCCMLSYLIAYIFYIIYIIYHIDFYSYTAPCTPCDIFMFFVETFFLCVALKSLANFVIFVGC